MKCAAVLGTVVDLGANRGQFALAARYCFPDARIISFEPLPGAAAVFRAVFAHDANVTLHQVAIGTSPGKALMHLSRRQDSSSLLPITSEQTTRFPRTEEVGTLTVDVALLSAYLTPDTIDPPALLKLDVQGFELQALIGCEELLPRFDWIYVECSFVELYRGQALADEMIDWLRPRGFTLHATYNVTVDAAGRPIQADFLFRR